MSRRNAKSTLIALGLFVLLTGPTPGSIGDCSAESSTMDPVAHCRLKESWVCARRGARQGWNDSPGPDGMLGTNDDVQHPMLAACLARVVPMCAGARWPDSCAPTQQQSAACIEAMMDGSNLGTPGECFPDSTTCGSPPVLGPTCQSCDQPIQCDLCPSGGALTSGDGGTGG
jgi:hypothetical protein